jgi:hypothetical protein
VDVVTKNCYKAYPSPKAMWKWAGAFATKKKAMEAQTTAKCARDVELARKKTADAEKKKAGSFSGGREPVQLITIAASWQ